MDDWPEEGTYVRDTVTGTVGRVGKYEIEYAYYTFPVVLTTGQTILFIKNFTEIINWT